VIENEGPPSLFQQKLQGEDRHWDGDAFEHNLFVFQGPWSEFTFADPDARTTLVEFCEEHTTLTPLCQHRRHRGRNPTAGVDTGLSA
jgi:hypothetical protein